MRKHDGAKAVVTPAMPVTASQAGARPPRTSRVLLRYNRVDVSLFMPRRWARLDDSTGCSRGA